MRAHEYLRRYLEQSGVKCSARPESEIVALENRYSVRLPEDFREYLRNACPATDNEMDAHVTTWWELARIKNVPEEYEHEVRNAEIAAEAQFYLFFADYMAWCSAWAINCGPGQNRGRVVTFSGDEPFVADSFTEFVEGYLKDADRMAFPPSP